MSLSTFLLADAVNKGGPGSGPQGGLALPQTLKGTMFESSWHKFSDDEKKNLIRLQSKVPKVREHGSSSHRERLATNITQLQREARGKK